MNIHANRFPLQRIVQMLPKPLRRIKVCQLIAGITHSPYHRLAFEQGELIGNVQDDSVANALVRAEFRDYGYFKMAGQLLAPGDTHVDVGANYGFHTFGLVKLPVSSTVRFVLIEANPDCAACLRESAKLHPALRFDIFHMAAAATAGEITFTFAASTTAEGHVGSPAGPGSVAISVPASPLDALFEKNGITSIGLMKMDIEGSEVSAIKSLSKMLSSHRVNFVYFEVNPHYLGLQQTEPTALFEEFTRHGYRLFWPHEEIKWILHTYGRGDVMASDLRGFTIVGNEPHKVMAFDQSLYRKGPFGQCDLLAVSPLCRVEE